MLSAVVTETVTVIDLGAYPRWLVVGGATLVLALAIWIVMKLARWTLWLLFWAVLIGGLAWTGWLLFQ